MAVHPSSKCRRSGSKPVRYIGNKSKLLEFIGSFLDSRGLSDGQALDAFSGTTAVGSYLKSRGLAVDACDIMTFSYVFQRAYIVADSYPSFEGLTDHSAFMDAVRSPEFAAQIESRFGRQGDLFSGDELAAHPLERVLVFLDTYLPSITSFVTRSYSSQLAAEGSERMFFTQSNAQRIDAIRHQVEDWFCEDRISADEYYVLLAALLEAADSVANTTGVYAAFLKTWQSNALRPLRLFLPPLVVGTGLECRAYQGDINQLIGTLGHFDLLYLDPPYNTRQYSGYYHVPEVIARGWFEGEPELRGKTGLIPDTDKKSAWSTREGCVPALEELIANADATFVLMSYNNEGIIPEEDIESIFRQHGVSDTYERVSRQYSRYRADADSDVRRYKADQTSEYLYFVQRS